MTTLAEKLHLSAERSESVEDILTAVNEDLMLRYQSPEWKTQVQQPEKISRLNRRVYLGLQQKASLLPLRPAQGYKKTKETQVKSPPTGKKHASASSKSPVGCGGSREVTSSPKPTKKRASTAKFLPHLSGDTPKEKLESYCDQVGKPSPKYSYSRMSARSFEGTAYVAQTCGWVAGEKRSTKAEAEEEAAAKLLEKLGY